MMQQIQSKAKAAGLDYPFLFLNDAGPGEDPFVTYGNLTRLRQVRRTYDAGEVFQRLMPGGFKTGV